MKIFLTLSLLLLVVTGCVSPAEPAGPHVTLYALQPAVYDYNIGEGEPLADPGHDPARGYFHSYKILGQVDLTRTDQGTALAGYLLEHTEYPQGLIAGCFEPRHGLRVVEDGNPTDYVICFSCSQFDWYAGENLEWVGKQAMPSDWYDRFTDPLTDAGIEPAE